MDFNPEDHSSALSVLQKILRDNSKMFISIVLIFTIAPPTYIMMLPDTYTAKGMVDIGYINVEAPGSKTDNPLIIEDVSNAVIRLKSQFGVETKTKIKLPKIQHIAKKKLSRSIIEIISLGFTPSEAQSKLTEATSFLVNEHNQWVQKVTDGLKSQIQLRNDFSKNNNLDAFKSLENKIKALDIERNLSMFRVRPTRTVGKIDIQPSTLKVRIVIFTVFCFILSIFLGLFLVSLRTYFKYALKK